MDSYVQYHLLIYRYLYVCCNVYLDVSLYVYFNIKYCNLSFLVSFLPSIHSLSPYQARSHRLIAMERRVFAMVTHSHSVAQKMSKALSGNLRDAEQHVHIYIHF